MHALSVDRDTSSFAPYYVGDLLYSGLLRPSQIGMSRQRSAPLLLRARPSKLVTLLSENGLDAPGHTCSIFRGFKTFGFHPREIGNKSIRSGAAMSLFLMDHSPAKIMILGHWSSDAFLVYIRPQVLEWTNNMLCDKIHPWKNDCSSILRTATSLHQMIPEPASGSKRPSMAETTS
jgi:hypothetical protein